MMTGQEESQDKGYYAVIFSSTRTQEGSDDYGDLSVQMAELAREQPGFLDVESARDPTTGFGITVSYWKDEASIKNWKANVLHRNAQKRGKTEFYLKYNVRIAKVEREYSKK